MRPLPVIIAVFDREDQVLRATTAATQKGLKIVDVFTPYAVHGLERAMGLRRSRLPWICFGLGLFGALAMAWLQYWTSAVSWPLDVGGKPWHSWPAFVPVMFEVMVLCGGLGTVLSFVVRARLRPGKRSLVADLGVTDDRFALALAAGERADRAAIDALLTSYGPVQVVERDLDGALRP